MIGIGVLICIMTNVMNSSTNYHYINTYEERATDTPDQSAQEEHLNEMLYSPLLRKHDIDSVADRLENEAKIAANYRAIRQALTNSAKQAATIKNARQLLIATKPQLQAIASRPNVIHINSYSRSISTQVVQIALHNVITQVNREQETYEEDPY